MKIMMGGSPAVVLALLVIVCNQSDAQKKAARFSEQMQFSAGDESVQRPVSIPRDVSAILARDEWVQDALESQKVPARELPASWFAASVIHLAGPDEIDLVVIAKGPLVGANVTTFWVFRSTPHGYRTILNGPALGLTVLHTRWKGYREIELTSATAVQVDTVLLRWDGSKYAFYREKTERN